jgi:hypothetical protein
MVIGAAAIDYASTRYNIQTSRKYTFLCEIGEGPVPVEWENATAVSVEVAQLERSGEAGAAYADCPPAASKAKNNADWNKSLTRWLKTNQVLTLQQSPTIKAVSKIGESESEFRIRLQQMGREQRDEQVEVLRRKYTTRLDTLQDRLRRAEQAIERQQAEARAAQLNTVASIGQSLLGAFLGRKATPAIRSAGSAIGRMSRESGDVGRAEDNADALRQQIQAIESELQTEIDRIGAAFDAQNESLEEVTITPKATDIAIQFVGLAWAPYTRDAQGRLSPAWE